MFLENIPKRNNRTKSGKRLGRGYGSGVGGHTSTRGSKGQKSRSGHKSLIFFEGGNVPFFRRMPKFAGFNRTKKIIATAINLDILQKNFKDGDTVSLETLKKNALIAQRTTSVKILGNGSIDKKIIISGIPASQSAKEKIQKAGGSIK